LPAEIRLIILDTIAHQRHPSWASFASFCSEWQAIIETRKFQLLKLPVSCLDAFERMVIRQRELVRHICLDIELRKYTCRTCDQGEQTDQNTAIFTKGVNKLFSILGPWKQASGLTLELNAYYPSDSDHCGTTDPDHGWVNGKQIASPPALAYCGSLSQSTCETGKALPELHLPYNLNRTSIFEEFSDAIVESLGGAIPIPRWMQPKLDAALSLSVSDMVDARDFFGACAPTTWIWERLESLALTSQLLRDTGSRGEIHALLLNAGTTALRMPRLRTLVLWNGQRENACAFIYRTKSDHASIIWRGNWGIDLSPRVVEAWRRAVLEGHSRHVFRVAHEEVRGVIGSHGDAMHRLNLPRPGFSPVSLWQMRTEGIDHRA
ncbi:hypothetical protein B0T26DRAFT_647594, partial [Lasiosphaeria miniovina]